MTISTLITELQKLQALHGDLLVAVSDNEGDANAHNITPELRMEKLWYRDEAGEFHFEPQKFIYIF